MCKVEKSRNLLSVELIQTLLPNSIQIHSSEEFSLMTSLPRRHKDSPVFCDPHQIFPCIRTLTLQEEKVLSPLMVYNLWRQRLKMLHYPHLWLAGLVSFTVWNNDSFSNSPEPLPQRGSCRSPELSFRRIKSPYFSTKLLLGEQREFEQGLPCAKTRNKDMGGVYKTAATSSSSKNGLSTFSYVRRAEKSKRFLQARNTPSLLFSEISHSFKGMEKYG